MKTRTEKDSLGPVEVPADAYYGVQTQRAVDNFPISGLHAHPNFIWATAAIKAAAARVNTDLGLLKPELGNAIEKAAIEVMEGKYHEQFVVDVYQAGAGTSHHMNANEVIANRAIELLGGKKGEYAKVHPNDHVNFGQSTNDVFPTAMRLAILRSLPILIKGLYDLGEELGQKSNEFKNVIKSGRTHLQDAVPVTLGQEFAAYARTVNRCIRHVKSASDELRELGIGGSAAGSGLNTHPNYRHQVTMALAAFLGSPLSASANLFESMQSMRSFAQFSASLKTCALELTRIANDFRLLSSGPNTGMNEIVLPAVQPGSSIMPGKVNPVMAEMLNMVCFQVIGNDFTVTMAAQAGQLELNVMMPVIIHNILTSMEILTNAVTAFTEKAVKGIKVNEDQTRHFFENTLGLATVLNVIIGYDQAAEVMKKSLKTGKTILQVVEEDEILTKEQIDKIFTAEKLTQPGVPGLE